MNCPGRHDGEPEPAIDGEHLCRGCKRKLRYALADIVELWPLLAVMLQPGGGGGGGRTKPGSRPACDLGVAWLRDEQRGTVTGQLRSWARVVIEDRRLAPRTLSAPQAAQLLDVHLDWLCAQPFVDEAAAEITSCAHAVRQACRDLPDPPLGKCTDIDPRGQADTCGGPLRWDDNALTCKRCGGRWTLGDLGHIGRVVPLDLWESVTNVARMLDIPDRTVRHWAAVGKIRRNSLGQVRHADAWRILAGKNDPQQRQTAEGLSTT